MILIIRLAALAGQVIGTLRSLNDVSQTELGEAADVAGSQISKYETSQVIPSLDVMVRLLRAGGWHLAAMPQREAETADARSAVVEAAMVLRAEARRAGASELDIAHASDGVVRACDALVVADRAARDGWPAAPAGRVEELMTLRARTVEQATEIERLRKALRLVGELIDAETEVHP